MLIGGTVCKHNLDNIVVVMKDSILDLKRISVMSIIRGTIYSCCLIFKLI